MSISGPSAQELIARPESELLHFTKDDAYGERSPTRPAAWLAELDGDPRLRARSADPYARCGYRRFPGVLFESFEERPNGPVVLEKADFALLRSDWIRILSKKFGPAPEKPRPRGKEVCSGNTTMRTQTHQRTRTSPRKAARSGWMGAGRILPGDSNLGGSHHATGVAPRPSPALKPYAPV